MTSRRAPRETGLARQQQREKVLALMAKKPKSKYRAVRCEVDGEQFDSKREMRHWLSLQMRQKVGEIRKLRRQVPYAIEVRGEHICKYIADFVFEEYQGWRCGMMGAWITVVGDSKGYRTRDFVLKKKLMKACYNIEIREL